MSNIILIIIYLKQKLYKKIKLNMFVFLVLLFKDIKLL